MDIDKHNRELIRQRTKSMDFEKGWDNKAEISINQGKVMLWINGNGFWIKCCPICGKRLLIEKGKEVL